MGSEEQLQALRLKGEVIWENSRYDATYVIDSASLSDFLHNAVPVVHLGQPEAVDAVLDATPDSSWLVVHLWCPRETAAKRIAARATGDAEARLRAWDVTPELPTAALRINTGVLVPEQAALAIRSADTPGSGVQTSTAGKRQAS
uniref:hypothetical protein n=1 Tax=Amycolatopsis sp. CA-082387 TaxID=3239918 RepID=UPI003F4932B1